MAGTVPKLVVLSGERQGTALEISDSLAIGSHRDSDLRLEDASVSWRHARVFAQGADVYVEDLNSATGTLVNGVPVRRAKLKAGDVVAVGSSRMAVSFDDGAPGPGSPVFDGGSRAPGFADALAKDLEDARHAADEARKELSALREELAAARRGFDEASR
ncbi:MAG: FHA domain-containing protein, partial [Planctomycetota bacterium]